MINHAHLGHLIEAALGDGSRFGLSIATRPRAKRLKTAGGIALALPLLGAEPFLVVNADIYSDYDYSMLAGLLLADRLAHLVLVDNPAQHPRGDFALEAGARAKPARRMLTFSGIGVYAPRLFSGIPPRAKVPWRRYCARPWSGPRDGRALPRRWHDVGTAERLDALNAGCATGVA